MGGAISRRPTGNDKKKGEGKFGLRWGEVGRRDKRRGTMEKMEGREVW